MNKITILFVFSMSCNKIYCADSMPDYKLMTKLNENPIDMDQATMLLCRDPKSTYGIHASGMMTYYENAIAGSRNGNEKFKIGSVIVKEKIVKTKEAIQPDVITVMEKITNNGTIEDWKFSIYSMKSKENITKYFGEKSSISCVNCHINYSANDFVSSEYFKIKSNTKK